MKKSLVSALATALVVGSAQAAFAAANPFEDVPAGHWAYGAIAQLAADGVIEGYGDGTYRGGQEITRYEMAQMIARAMAKGGSGADKVLIDKLAAEFADELQSLGVRVAALEKIVDNVKWTGAVRYRYANIRLHSNPAENKPIQSNAQYVTLRLEPEMTINKNWTAHARLDYSTDMNSAKNATNGKIAENDADDEFVMEHVWVQGDYKNFQLLLGKLPYMSNSDNGMLFDDNVAGGQITVGSKVKGTITVGRASAEAAGRPGWPRQTDPDDPATAYTIATASYQGIEIYNNSEDKINWGIGYHRFANKAVLRELYTGNDKESMNLWDVGLGWQLDKNFNLNGAYAWNTSAKDTDETGQDSKRAWTVQLDYKGAEPADKGSWGAFVAYRSLGQEAVWAPTYDTISAGQKGVEMGFEIIPMKNFSASFIYFIGKDKINKAAGQDDDASMFFTELNFFF